MEKSDKFLWPQDNRQLMRERIRRNQLSPISLIKKAEFIFEDLILVFKSVLAFLGLGNFKKIEEKIMFIFNGSNTKRLSNKFEFLELCKNLGYKIPNQVLIKNNQTIEERKKLFESEFHNDGHGFYLKPVEGYGGKGIRIFNTKKEVEEALGDISDKTIIEEAINIYKEFRYILYSDPDGNNWHLSFEKTRSFVDGNGKSRLITLILISKHIPIRRKFVLFRVKFKELRNITPIGEKLLLEHKCSYGKLPSETEINNLDKFVPILIKDLEKNIGHRLPILCFDFGATFSLEKDLSFDELKKTLVPFECQIPFSPLAHFKFIKNGFWPFIDFYKMLILDMLDIINKRVSVNS